MTVPLNPMDIHQLINSTKKIAAGDFSVRIRPVAENYSLSELAENINKIAQILEKKRPNGPDTLYGSHRLPAGMGSDGWPFGVGENQFQARKMECVGRLAGGIAHDFNNMLSVILGYSELMKMQLAPDNPLLAHLQEIEKAAIHSKETTNKLLAFSRKQVMSPRLLDLNRAVEKIIPKLAEGVGKDVAIAFKPTGYVDTIRFDPAQLEQILAHMAVNAKDAMPEGGRLVIETGNVELDSTYCQSHPGAVAGQYAVLSVSDTGHGMAKEIQEQIFEPFFTTKPQGEGMGMGLATVYGIVKQNRGYITVYSEPARGTVFKIYIPAADTAAAGKKDVSRGNETILVVDDDDMVRSLTAIMLKKMGYTVLASDSPAHALSLCRKNRGIDLLLTDVMMPDINGVDLKGKVAELIPDIKVLFMSGYTSNIVTRYGVPGDTIHFISKPFSLNALARKVRDVMASHL